ncbi:Adhesion G-protein coupled receptor G4 [Holothuria leucospilota]|uniref:Adhesion G-protein coupled receptor G4 n=1 Tax=Holothuria leucospilota TaxID=206669 RepID=A0A9Q1BEI0_HOLLE|nr:Adhesion G-protein coupled receptor G4 [Holothuria leucospilota]
MKSTIEKTTEVVSTTVETPAPLPTTLIENVTTLIQTTSFTPAFIDTTTQNSSTTESTNMKSTIEKTTEVVSTTVETPAPLPTTLIENVTTLIQTTSFTPTFIDTTTQNASTTESTNMKSTIEKTTEVVSTTVETPAPLPTTLIENVTTLIQTTSFTPTFIDTTTQNASTTESTNIKSTIEKTTEVVSTTVETPTPMPTTFTENVTTLIQTTSFTPAFIDTTTQNASTTDTTTMESTIERTTEIVTTTVETPTPMPTTFTEDVTTMTPTTNFTTFSTHITTQNDPTTDTTTMKSTIERTTEIVTTTVETPTPMPTTFTEDVTTMTPTTNFTTFSTHITTQNDPTTDTTTMESTIEETTEIVTTTVETPTLMPTTFTEDVTTMTPTTNFTTFSTHITTQNDPTTESTSMESTNDRTTEAVTTTVETPTPMPTTFTQDVTTMTPTTNFTTSSTHITTQNDPTTNTTTMESTIERTTKVVTTTVENTTPMPTTFTEDLTTMSQTTDFTTSSTHITTQNDPTTEFTCTRPSPVDPPLYVQPDKGSYSAGEVVTYSCSSGFLRTGPETSRCESQDLWIPSEVPVCIPEFTCTRPSPVDPPLYVQPDKGSYSAGEVVTYSCSSGFLRSGPETSRCDSQDLWEPSEVPVCIPEYTCTRPSPVDPPLYVQPDKGSYSAGEVVTYSCSSGYLRNGPEKSTCESQDLWNPSEVPVCILEFTCTRPSPVDAPLSLQPDKHSYSAGEIVTYSCPRGFYLNGPANSRCESQDSWNPPVVPICISEFSRRFLLPHLAAWTQPVQYYIGYMDTDLSNVTMVRIVATTGESFEDFHGGITNSFDYSAPGYEYELSHRPSFEIQTTDDIHLYTLPSIYEDQILCHPIDSLSTDYILVTSGKSNYSSFLITATEEDTEVSIFLPYDFEQDETVYNFNKALRMTLYELQTVVVNVSFVSTAPYVKATKPVSIMVEHRTKNGYPYGDCLSSFYLPPVKHWGVHHSIPISDNITSFWLTMAAAYDNTEVELAGYHQNGVYVKNYDMNAWQVVSTLESIGRDIEIYSTKPIIVLLEEFLTIDDVCHTIVVASTDKALDGGIPIFISNFHYLQGYVRVWVSNEDDSNLLVDDRLYQWTRLGNESFIYQTYLKPGYHVIRSSNEESRLLVSIGGTFYAAHDMYTEIQKMCPFDRIFFSGVKLTFRATSPGSSSLSLEKCPDSSSNADLNLASRICSDKGWEEPILVECFTSSEDVSQEIEKLSNTTVTEENVEEVAQDIAVVTTQTEELTSNDIDNVADSLDSIANTGSSSPEVTDSVVGTVNNIMQVDETTLEESGESITVVSSLEQQISNVQQNPDNFTEVEDNVGVKAVKLNKNITKGLTFLTLKRVKESNEQTQTNSLSEDTTQLINNEKEIRLDNTTASLYLPPKIFEIATEADPNMQNVPLSFFIYKDARLFQPTLKNDETYSSYEIREEIASQVIAANLEMENVTIRNLSSKDSVVTRFETFNLTEENEFVRERRCVFWYVAEETSTTFWSSEGCSMETNSSNSMETVCYCSHLTSFAVLFCVSLVDKLENVRRKQSSKIHINLYISLIGFYLTFLLGEVAIGNPKFCRIAAMAIHYFCLTTVAWTCAESVNMYFMFVKYRRASITNFLPISFLLAYGLPLIPTLIVYFIDPYEYKLDDYCFLHPGYCLSFGMLLEILLMIIFNIVIYVLVVKQVLFRPMLSQRTTQEKRKEIVNRLQYIALFWILLGLSWTFGFLILIPNRKTQTFEILFCVFTSLQGVLLFLFVCLRNSEVKKALKKSFKKEESARYVIKNSSSGSKSGLKSYQTDSFSSLAYTNAFQD